MKIKKLSKAARIKQLSEQILHLDMQLANLNILQESGMPTAKVPHVAAQNLRNRILSLKQQIDKLRKERNRLL